MCYVYVHMYVCMHISLYVYLSQLACVHMHCMHMVNSNL